jgi:SAM-dependent methyltransferase
MDDREPPVTQLSWDPLEHYKDVEVAERYDAERFSRLSGRVFNGLEKRNVRKAFQGVPAGATVVDAPCGTGRLAEVLLDCGFHVVGVDISPAMLEVARRKLARFGSRFEPHVCDARRLATLKRRFDAALCARVLMHFPLSQQIEFVRGIADVTSQRIVFTHGYDTRYQRFRRRVKRWLRQGGEPVGFPLREDQLQRLFAETGLREIDRLRIFPAISEAITVVTERTSPLSS